MGRQELCFLDRMVAATEIDVVGVQPCSSELGVGIRVLDRCASTDENPGPTAGRPQSACGDVQRMRPGCRHQLSVRVADEGCGDAIASSGIGECPSAFVAVPLFVHLWVVPGQSAHHFAPPMIGALCATACAVLTDAGAGNEVERPGAEAIRRTRQCPHRTDLHGVTREIGLEWFVCRDPHLLLGSSFEEIDERVAGDLFGKPGAPCAQYAPLAVEQHLARQWNRFGEGTFDSLEARLCPPGGHRLVL